MAAKVGSIVRLNSGGPLMTLEEVKNDRAMCVWFVDGSLRRDSFVLATLLVVEDGLPDGV